MVLRWYVRIGVNGVDRSECIGGGECFWLFGRTIKGNWVGILWLVVTIHPPPSRDHTPMRSVTHHPIYSPAAEKGEEKAKPRLITCDQLKIDELWISWCTDVWKLISIDLFEKWSKLSDLKYRVDWKTNYLPSKSSWVILSMLRSHWQKSFLTG